ncbi:GNAT family N-acetyltransferase [Trinickia mobilis]|uniref:GNAT family N-acetyltransferase n=1 Tax=Trinickia mobilis TaxID=2816356 RepID=UPI001A8DA775|nr:GNAT family N-acetyltransferase [Trinickia mobilis]
MTQRIENANLATYELELAGMLARAFEQDPLARYVFPDDAVRRRRLISVYRLYLRVFARGGRVLVNDARSAAALWLPPGRYPLTWAQHLRLLPRMLWATGATGFAAATRVLDHLDSMHPAGKPFWYLGVLGVDPASQHRGLGSELLRVGLRVCDQEDVAAYLETAEPGNLSFYARFGFSELVESRLRGGPTVWSLWRDPDRDSV